MPVLTPGQVLQLVPTLVLGFLLWDCNNHLFRNEAHNAVGKPILSASDLVPTTTSSGADGSCRRYAMVSNPSLGGAGLGHRFGDIIFSYIFALEANATMVLQDKVFTLGGAHGAYDWAMDFLGLNGVEYEGVVKERYNLEEQYMPSWGALDHRADSCNVLVKTCDRCCKRYLGRGMNGTGWCFATKLGAYDFAKTYFRKLHTNSNFKPPFDLYNVTRKSKELVVAWHFRIGDITIQHTSSPEYFAKIHGHIKQVVGRTPFKLYLFSEGPLDERFAFTKKYNPIYLDNLDPAQTLQHMVDSDIFVGSGSSFSAMAIALMTPDKLAFQPPAKEQNWVGVYEVTDHAFVDRMGELIHPKISELQERVSARYQKLYQG